MAAMILGSQVWSDDRLSFPLSVGSTRLKEWTSVAPSSFEESVRPAAGAEEQLGCTAMHYLGMCRAAFSDVKVILPWLRQLSPTGELQCEFAICT